MATSELVTDITALLALKATELYEDNNELVLGTRLLEGIMITGKGVLLKATCKLDLWDVQNLMKAYRFPEAEMEKIETGVMLTYAHEDRFYKVVFSNEWGEYLV